MKVEILMSPGCGHGGQTTALVTEVLRASGSDLAVEVTIVATEADAERLRFPGSPTVRVNGVDIDPAPPTRIGLG